MKKAGKVVAAAPAKAPAKAAAKKAPAKHATAKKAAAKQAPARKAAPAPRGPRPSGPRPSGPRPSGPRPSKDHGQAGAGQEGHQAGAGSKALTRREPAGRWGRPALPDLSPHPGRPRPPACSRPLSLHSGTGKVLRSPWLQAREMWA